MGRTSNQPVETPGAAAADTAAHDGPTLTVEEQLAAAQAELAALKAKAALPQVVYEPKTPHGAAALSASAYASMTVAELMAKIDAGEVKEPITSALCADGYYARR